MNPAAKAQISVDKAALRDRLLALRAALPLEERQRHAAAVSNHLIQWLDKLWLPAHPGEGVGVYLATPGEINIDDVARHLLELGVPVGAPVVGLHDLALTFHAIGDPALVPVAGFRIREPSRETPQLPVSLVLVPGTAFTPQGHRLGMGKGCYDRTLEAGHFTVGVAYALQMVPQLPVEDHDRRMDAIATPDGLIFPGA